MMSPPWNELRGRSVTVPEHVVFRDLRQETVLLNVRSGEYHSVDPVGARFFAVMREGGTLFEATQALAGEYGQPRETVEADMAVFVAQLLELGLVELATVQH